MHLQDIYALLSLKIIPLIFAMIGFGALIGIHEFGHFLFAKLFGIHTPTFSIGFGPELFRKKIGRTNFRLALLPFGGYCEIAGSAEIGQGDQAFADATGEDSFATKPYWQQLLVMLGGIIFNIIFAYFAFFSLFMIGSSDPQAIMIAGVVKGSAAELHGLKPGDAIIKINESSLLDDNGNLVENALITLKNTIKKNPNTEVNVAVLRNNEKITLGITLGSVQENDTTIGLLGANFREPFQKLPFVKAIIASIQTTNDWIIKIIQSIGRLVSQRTLDGAGGPLMILSMSFGAAQSGLAHLLMFLAIISINLAIFNLLPVGALDGGQIFFVTIEALLGRKIPLLVRNGINILSWLLFIGLALFLTYKDIGTLFGEKILSLYNKIVSLVR